MKPMVEQLEDRLTPSASFGLETALMHVPPQAQQVLKSHQEHVAQLPTPPWSDHWAKLPGGYWAYASLPAILARGTL